MAREGAREERDGTEPTVTLAGRYEILPERPLPALASPTAPAFAVRDARDPSRRLFALLCSKKLPFREETLMALRRLSRPQLMPPLEWGLVDWPAEEPWRGRGPAIVFEMPGGGRLMPSLSAAIPPVADDVLTRNVIRPILAGLRELAGIGVSHGAIRPDNMFYRSDPAGDVILGENCSAPPGFAQPVLFVPIEAGMCSPGGRGPGSVAEDLYALGVTLLLLLLGRNPLQDLDDHAIVAAKIGQGSFAAIAGQARISAGMTELLRGLLADNVNGRWTFDQLSAWVDGRRLSPNPPNLPPRAGRPFPFDGAEYWTRPALAHAMARSWDKAIDVARSGQVEPWLRRSFGDIRRAKALESAASFLRDASAAGRAEHALVAWALMALHPEAPVRYRDFATRLDSLGPALAAGFDRPGAVQHFVEMIDSKLGSAWMELQGENRIDFVPVRKTLDMVRYFLDRPGPGFSIERCLYELNPGVPCRSPLLEEEYVSKLSELLPALNRVAARVDHEREPMDRHIAAFIAARAKTLLDRDLAALGSSAEVYRQRLAVLRLLAAAEKASAAAERPALLTWLAAFAGPIVDSYQYRPYRAVLLREIGRIVERGRIADLVRLLENEEMRRRDTDGLARAKIQYAMTRREVAWLEEDGMTAPDRVARLANRAAAATSTTTAGFVLFGLVLRLAF